MSKHILKSPGGMRSYLPSVAGKLEQIRKEIEKTFALWGYKPVVTPTIEYYNSLTRGMGSRLDKELYKFIDYEGQILALRPEMTAPIARTLANRLSDIELPQRLSYNASVFRYDEPQTGKNREIYQTGVELIGEAGELADAEAIILAIESLLEIGIKNINIDIGHVGYLDGILEKMNLEEDDKTKIKTYLNKRDLVGLDNFIEKLKIDDKELLETLPALRGDYTILDEAALVIENKKSRKAVKNLQEIYQAISNYGYGEYINFDLSLIRGFDYYTGVVFEGFTENLGYTICGGGRYDNLIKQYCDSKIPAIGFAIGIERVRLALSGRKKMNVSNQVDLILAFDNISRNKYLTSARKLREKGLTVVLADLDTEFEKADLVKQAKAQGIKAAALFNIDEENDSKDTIELLTIDTKDSNYDKEDSNYDTKNSTYIEIEDEWEEELCQKL